MFQLTRMPAGVDLTMARDPKFPDDSLILKPDPWNDNVRTRSISNVGSVPGRESRAAGSWAAVIRRAGRRSAWFERGRCNVGFDRADVGREQFHAPTGVRNLNGVPGVRCTSAHSTQPDRGHERVAHRVRRAARSGT
jgi:hypothetical protein